jgi:hypothetical protein
VDTSYNTENVIPATLAVHADELFSFDGDPECRKPAYWVARVGCTVISQIAGRAMQASDEPTIEQARAAFAEATCDAVPQVGDTIKVVWGRYADQQFKVDRVSPGVDDFYVHATTVGGRNDGARRVLALIHGQYEIVRRPAGD